MRDSAEWTDIRPGRQADVPAVLALLDSAVRWLTARGRPGQWGTEPLSGNPRLTALVARIAADGGLHVAVRGERVVGALGFGDPPAYVARAAEPELYIVLLVTDRDHNGQGIGARLLEHARTVAAQAGAGLLRVDCYAGDDQALVRYYEGQGFTRTQRFTMAQPADPWPGQVLEQRLPS
ncbi:GNAT family N-acetyltransferase [Actinoplanes aureus]|jgi:ribosomal protein S18 acetylase RimI-like enzyme|uniref:GNAT family N-acetyltransferase n=1 Tax=Actinoplanes aureus TaxID=2792083 RepID=A0A931FW74_9ACTN|nr:GNAT family N-acetyltransferase [Actinoplanes aureus]MBG0562123.1 GNAT family N-acetyltransferase [Actinoplanes aureus]